MHKTIHSHNIQLSLNSPLATDLKKTIINNIFIKYVTDKAIEFNLDALITADYLKQKALDEADRYSKQHQTLNRFPIDQDLLHKQLMQYYSLFLVNCYYLTNRSYGMPFYYPHYRKFSLRHLLQFIFRLRLLARIMCVQLLLFRFNAA